MTYGGVKTLESLEIHDSCAGRIGSLAPDALSGYDAVLVSFDRSIGEEMDILPERIQAYLLHRARID
jgi:hypothetical protein